MVDKQVTCKRTGNTVAAVRLQVCKLYVKNRKTAKVDYILDVFVCLFNLFSYAVIIKYYFYDIYHIITKSSHSDNVQMATLGWKKWLDSCCTRSLLVTQH